MSESKAVYLALPALLVACGIAAGGWFIGQGLLEARAAIIMSSRDSPNAPWPTS